jgi:hypothetical protein
MSKDMKLHCHLDAAIEKNEELQGILGQFEKNEIGFGEMKEHLSHTMYF